MAERSSNSNPPSTAAYPLLVQVRRRADPSTSRARFFSLPDRKLHDVSLAEVCSKTFHDHETPHGYETPQGWVLVLTSRSAGDHSSPETFLLDPRDGSTVELPPLDDGELPEECRCVLSDHGPDVSGCGVLVFDLQSPAMWFCRVGGRRWTRHEYDIGCYDLAVEYPRKRNFFDVAGVGGRFYFYEETTGELGTLDFTGDPEDPEAVIGAVAVVPGIELATGKYQACFVATYLVESCGEMFVVGIVFPGIWDDWAAEVNVYRMDFSAPGGACWRKTTDVGDRAFLLGESSFAASCSASGCGVKASCVYWVDCFSEDKKLHVLGMDNGVFEIVKTFEEDPGAQTPFWLVPTSTS